jgi:micrococcal nuclease
MDAAPSAEIRVIDGDTFRAGRETIRIENIGAPEAGKRSRCTAENYLSQLATERLRQILASGAVQIDRHGPDPFKRTLALVRVNGEDMGQMMIGHRLAVTWAGRRHDWCGGRDAKR